MREPVWGLLHLLARSSIKLAGNVADRLIAHINTRVRNVSSGVRRGFHFVGGVESKKLYAGLVPPLTVPPHCRSMAIQSAFGGQLVVKLSYSSTFCAAATWKLVDAHANTTTTVAAVRATQCKPLAIVCCLLKVL